VIYRDFYQLYQLFTQTSLFLKEQGILPKKEFNLLKQGKLVGTKHFLLIIHLRGIFSVFDYTMILNFDNYSNLTPLKLSHRVRGHRNGFARSAPPRSAQAGNLCG
jgi:hypothetical protein